MSKTLNAEDAWNAVSLEERLELISKAQADGVLSALGCLLLVGSVAYGFDYLWLLGVGALLSIIVMPISANRSWRRSKPSLILQYLAARSVARRYAFAYKLPGLELIIIFRAELEEHFDNPEAEEAHRSAEGVDFHTHYDRQRPVWVALLRGGVVVISERHGGAKLDFITPLSSDLVCRRTKEKEDFAKDAIVLDNAKSPQGRTVAISSRFPGALYVFERHLNRLIFEHQKTREKVANLAKKSPLK